MKKITFLFLMLLSVTAFSQIEIVENFDTTANNQVPASWTGSSMAATSSFACGGSGKSIFTLAPAGGTASLTTPNYTAISNGTDLTVSFSYNIFEQVSQFPPPSYTAPATDWGSLVLEYSTNGGSTWTTVTTIDDSNYTFGDTNTCQATANIDAGAITTGADFQARFVVNVVNVSGFRLVAILDNVSFKQVATTIPNCDATLLNPLNGSTTADTDLTLTWQAATGLATGYTVSVGTTSGGTEIVNSATTSSTSYSLAGLGLTYETQYFVTIVPFNGIGIATGCTEESFTTRVAPIAGATCSSPLVISALPYFVSADDTANYEDNYDSSPCNNTYLSGPDVFYQITPTTDISINIELQNIVGNGASIHVVEGCIDAATECIAYVGSFSGTSRSLTDVVLTAGNTYNIVLSSSSNTRTYTYSLIITQNSCINPTFELAPAGDCGNGQFSVNVDVTYLGSAASLTLSDNFGNSNTNVTTTGVVNMGPYTSGSTVNFTLTNNQDGACSYADSTYFYCPPSNDDCGDSIALTINTDDTCTIFTSATNAGATQSVTDPTACSAANNTNDVWFSFVASNSTIILEYLNITEAIGGGGTIQATELLEGNCGSFTSLACYNTNYVTLTNLTVGNTYYIRNNTRLNGEYAQNYDICLKEPPAPPANDACLNATALTVSTDGACNNQVSGTTIGATLSANNSCDTDGYADVWYVFNPAVTGIYEFSYERINTNPSSSYVIYEGSCGSLIQKSTSCSSTSNQIFTLNSGISYYIMIRSSLSGSGVDFNLCVSQLPDAVANNDCSTPAVLLESTDFNGNNTITGNMDNSYNSPESCGSSTYEAIWYSFTATYTGVYNFDFTRGTGSAYYTVFNTDNCADTLSDGYITGFSSCYNSGDKTGEVVAGNTYLISVHASSAATFSLFVYPDPNLSIEQQDFEAFKYYPNPVENTLTIEAGTPISNINVYNMLGQQVQAIAPNNLKSTIDMNDLNDGVYFVTVTINNSQKTFKVIKK